VRSPIGSPEAFGGSPPSTFRTPEVTEDFNAGFPRYWTLICCFRASFPVASPPAPEAAPLFRGPIAPHSPGEARSHRTSGHGFGPSYARPRSLLFAWPRLRESPPPPHQRRLSTTFSPSVGTPFHIARTWPTLRSASCVCHPDLPL